MEAPVMETPVTEASGLEIQATEARERQQSLDVLVLAAAQIVDHGDLMAAIESTPFAHS